MINYKEKIRAVCVFRKMKIGERRFVGDYYQNQFGELVRLEDEPSFFQRKLSERHMPHYRIEEVSQFKK